MNWTIALIVIAIAVLAFIIGFYSGARFVTPRTRTKQPAPKRAAPIFANGTVISMAEWRKLDLPPSKRVARIEVIK